MPQKIEMLEPEWRPPEAQALYEQIQEEIRKAYILPTWAMYSPSEHQRFMQQAHDVTEHLRREAARLYMYYRLLPRAVLVDERVK